MSTVKIPAWLSHVNHNLLQAIASSTGASQNQPAMASGKRPIFHAEIGRSLANLREERGLSQMQVEIASGGKLRAGTLKSIETGRIKNPDPDHLRVLARIYKVGFERMAEPFLIANYGRDLTRHFGDQQSGSSSHVGDQTHDAAEARMELERLRLLVGQYEKEAREVRTATDAIVRVALRLEKIRKTEGAQSHRGRRDRKVG